MSNEVTTSPVAGPAWQAKQVYAMAVICLMVGLAIGYLFRGSQSAVTPAQSAADAQAHAQGHVQGPAAAGQMGGHMPSLEDMKRMADKKAAPLVEKLKTDPNNKDLLLQVGHIYEATHQFKDAAGYYDRALQIDPKDVAIRTAMASCLYYSDDVDGAIRQLQQALHYDPKDANSLFNLGMIKWQGKQDSQGALAAWRELLKRNPELSAERKATVQKLMAEVQMKGKSQTE
jgi:cytochrome c-type biogenesis protein CcmH/NrfG